MNGRADNNALVPDNGAVDDTNTMEGQLTEAGGPPHLPRHLFYQLRKYLSDASYPASRTELYDHAHRHGADAATLDTLGQLTQRSYNTFNDIKNEIIARNS